MTVFGNKSSLIASKTGKPLHQKFGIGSSQRARTNTAWCGYAPNFAPFVDFCLNRFVLNFFIALVSRGLECLPFSAETNQLLRFDAIDPDRGTT